MINLNMLTESLFATATLANNVTVEITACEVSLFNNTTYRVTFAGGLQRIYNKDGVNQFSPDFNIVKLVVKYSEPVPLTWKQIIVGLFKRKQPQFRTISKTIV